jgi:hypothetical protein
MKKSIHRMLAIMLAIPTLLHAQELKESASVEITTETFADFHIHNGVSFAGQLQQCGNKKILNLRVVNREPSVQEIRIGFLNGTTRLPNQTMIIQPMQEVIVSCSGGLGIPPIYLLDGETIRIETIVSKRN